MKEWFAKIGVSAGGVVRLIRGNMLLLFLTAFVVGGLVKVGFSEFVTMGYNDYLVERHQDLNFEKMKEDVTKRNAEALQSEGEDMENVVIQEEKE